MTNQTKRRALIILMLVMLFLPLIPTLLVLFEFLRYLGETFPVSIKEDPFLWGGGLLIYYSLFLNFGMRWLERKINVDYPKEKD